MQDKPNHSEIIMDDEGLMYILKEIRSDVKELRKDLTGVKVKLAGVTVTLSILASYFYKKLGL